MLERCVEVGGDALAVDVDCACGGAFGSTGLMVGVALLLGVGVVVVVVTKSGLRVGIGLRSSSLSLMVFTKPD